MKFTKTHWGIVLVALMAAAAGCAIAGIWTYDWRLGATGSVFAVAAYFTMFRYFTA